MQTNLESFIIGSADWILENGSLSETFENIELVLLFCLWISAVQFKSLSLAPKGKNVFAEYLEKL